jgi:RNA polymerase sigma-70 factor (ECF subfamily)
VNHSVSSHRNPFLGRAQGPSLETLLESLCNGDRDAAEQAFIAFEPHLRMVVRRQLSPRLRSKFDSCDVIQSVWADLLKGFRESSWEFRDAHDLRRFLVKATRHRFIDRARRYRRAAENESSLACADEGLLPCSSEPTPVEQLEAEELWSRMIELCPARHRDLLELRRSGASLGEIASRSGLHEGSVRRIFYDLSRRLAASSRPVRASLPPY